MDGGGTITKVVVCDLEGNIINAFQTGSINHFGAGTERAGETFAAISDNLISKFGCLPGILFIGNSALDGRADETLVQTLTKGVFHPSKTVFHSDVYVALLGYTLGKPGAVLISGTGSMACGIDADGVYHTAGGWGQILGDEGSGYHMALKGIKAALRGYDGISGPTRLTSEVIRFFNLTEMTDLIDRIYNPPVEKSVIAAFAPEVESAAVEGDTVAMKILDDEAKWLFKLALVITGKCKTKNLGYYGSVLIKSELIRSRLSALLSNQNISLQVPALKPETGALIGAFRESGNPVTETVVLHLSKYQ